MEKGLGPWEPFRGLSGMFDGDWDVLPTLVSLKDVKMPSIDVTQDEKSVTVEASLAGYKTEQVDIRLDDEDMLTISGKAEEEKETKEKDYFQKEIRKGSFERSVQLPTIVVGKDAKATFKNGVLMIVLPKAKEEKQNSVKIAVH